MKRKVVFMMFLVGSLLFAGTTMVTAQPGPRMTPEERAQRQTDQMKTELNLTSSQETQVKAINLKYAQKMHDVFTQNQGGDMDTMRQKMGELQDQKRTELTKVLSADQLKKYDDMVAQMRQNRGGPR